MTKFLTRPVEVEASQNADGNWVVQGAEEGEYTIYRPDQFKALYIRPYELMPKVYATVINGRIELCAYPCDHPDENELNSYMMELIEYRSKDSKDPVAIGVGLNVLRNILYRAGVRLVDE